VAINASIDSLELVDTSQNGSIDSLETQFTAINASIDSLEAAGGGGGGGPIEISDVTGLTDALAGKANFPTRFEALTVETDFWNVTTPFAQGLAGAAIVSGSIIVIEGEPNHPGIVALRDSTSANGGYRIMTEIAAIRLAGGERNVTVFKRRTTKTTAQFRMGFHDSTTSVDPVDGAYFQYVGSTGVLEARTRNNNTQTIAGTTYTLANDTWHTAVVEIVTTTSAVFTIFDESGTQVYQQTITTNIPSTAGRAVGCGVIATESTNDAAAELIQLDYLRFEINRTLVR
jgi:hypothetical protein